MIRRYRQGVKNGRLASEKALLTREDRVAVVPGWWRVFVYSFVIYIPLFLYLGLFWMSMTQAAIVGFVAALPLGMVLNLTMPRTFPSSGGVARKVPKVFARKVPKNR